MPQHRPHTILGKLIVDAIVPEMPENFGQRDFTIEVFENGKKLQKLLIGDKQQVLPVPVQHLPIALENAHHFHHILRRIR
jgi:hypothetical protein